MELQREGGRDRPSAGSQPQVVAMARVRQSQSQKPGVSSQSDTWVGGARVLGPSPTAFLGMIAGHWIRRRAAKT